MGATVRMVRAALKEQIGKHPESKKVTPNDQEDETPNVSYVELNSHKDCVRLVDEKVVLGLAKTFRSQIVLRETSSDKKSQVYRIYKPPNARTKKIVTLGYNGTSYKKVENEILFKTDKTFECQECDKVFKREQALTSHLRCHKSRFCRFCNEEFRTEGDKLASSLVVFHENKCHPEETAKRKKIRCKKCDKVFSHRPSLLRHKDVCSPSCPDCKLTFRTTGGLKKHKCVGAIETLTPQTLALLKKARAKAMNNPEKKVSYYQGKIDALREKMFSPI